ncbi:hypothetical protein FIU97_16075 [Roseivivax sp. THAF40]|nr:hypothetical protein FIV09_15660 [Roseivivax sp. THAF197b]QFT48100.1 hypothetical protein FIU97_16075 [Roseivivax sp. THAF40]
MVAQAAYRHDGPPAITLYTMVSNNSGAGAHSSLMINGSERVIFDPAGSVRHSRLAEREDVLYGVTPEIARFYELAHARETYHVVVQRIEVSPEVAEQALQLARTNGRVAQAFCTMATSGLLRKLPGFEGVGQTFFPLALSKDFERLPGVETRRVYDNDGDDKTDAIQAFDQVVSAQN